MTRPSSAFCLTTLTSSLRRCSVGTGNDSRITVPSLDGVMPRSELCSAFSMAAERALVVGRDHQQAGLGNAEPGHLAQLGLGAVVVDLEVLDQGRRGPAGADGPELGLGVVHGLGHVVPGVGDHQRDQVVVH